MSKVINSKVKIGKQLIPITIDLTDLINIKLKFPYHKDLVDEVKAMAGSKWNGVFWTVSNSRRNLFAIRYLLKIETPQNKNYKLNINEQIYPCLDELWPHQQEMYKFTRTRKRAIVAAEPRTGKTRPILKLFNDSEYNVAYFITTKSASLGIYLEFRKWYPNIHIHEQYLYNYKKYLKGISEQSKHAFILTYDEMKKVDIEETPGFIVFDELHKLKNDESNRSIFALNISEFLEDKFNGKEYIIGLTGTPAPKNPSDWWSQCEIIRSGIIREGSVKQFKNRYTLWDDSNPEAMPWEKDKGWNDIEVSQIYKRLSPLVIVFLQKDVLPLPKIIWEEIEVPPTNDMLRAAKVLNRTIINPLSLKIKLRQLSDGFSYINEYDENSLIIKRTGSEKFTSPKLERLKQDLIGEENDGKGRFIVYSSFQESVDMITEMALNIGWSVLQIDGRGRKLLYPKVDLVEGACFTDNESILFALSEMDRSTNKWQIKKLVFNAQTDSGGTGLELSASSIIGYYSNSEFGEGRMQSFRRAYSANMDMVKGLTVRDYFCLPTDKLLKESLDEKIRLQELSMSDLKKKIEKVLISKEK